MKTIIAVVIMSIGLTITTEMLNLAPFSREWWILVGWGAICSIATVITNHKTKES